MEEACQEQLRIMHEELILLRSEFESCSLNKVSKVEFVRLQERIDFARRWFIPGITLIAIFINLLIAVFTHTMNS